MGLAAKPAALLHTHIRITSLSVSAVSAVRWMKGEYECVCSRRISLDAADDGHLVTIIKAPWTPWEMGQK
jgi:hypothetical protein